MLKASFGNRSRIISLYFNNCCVKLCLSGEWWTGVGAPGWSNIEIKIVLITTLSPLSHLTATIRSPG